MSQERDAAASETSSSDGPRRGPRRADATTALTGYLLLLLWLPSQLIFAPLGAAGTPAQVLGMVFLSWRCADWLSRSQAVRVPMTGVLASLLLLAAAQLVSYVVAGTRPLSGVELRSADRAMLTLCALVGVVLVAESIRSVDRLEVLLRRFVGLAAVVALLGIVQFVTDQPWVDRITVPGLVLNSDLAGVLGRVGFARPAGTAVHPIEFGVVLTMTLPSALHYAYRDGDRPRWRRWAPPALIALAVPLSISRSAVLSALVGMLVLLPTWPRHRRRQAYALMVLLAGVVYVTIPGLLGAIRELFLGIQNDDSARSRTDSYDLVWEFVKRDPVAGRGPGTFLPSYRILDNQYLGTIIETGVLGLAALLALLTVGVLTGRRVRRESSDPSLRDLAQSLAAGVAAGGVTFATFDGLTFPMSAGVLFVLLGCLGALRRLTRAGSAPQQGTSAFG